ncbi:MAG: PIG-L family deacetylase [Acidimicrobiales bacterium]
MSLLVRLKRTHPTEAPTGKQAPLVLISPHLDDAVFSCSQVLLAHPGTTVISVFAGRPPDGRWSEWDEKCFLPGQDPMTVLREEDRQALQCLGATPVHLPFLDVEYGTTYEIEEIADAIAAQLDALGPESVLIPLGIQHLDHVTTHRAVVRLIRERPQIRWIIYEELPYRLEYAEYRQTQVRELLEGGFRLSELALPRNLSTRPKLRAIHKYESQCKAMGRKRIRLALLDERYWEVSVVGDTEAVGP